MRSWSTRPFDLRIVRSEGRRKGSHAERLFDLAIRLDCLWLEGDELTGFEGGDGYSVTQEDAVRCDCGYAWSGRRECPRDSTGSAPLIVINWA